MATDLPRYSVTVSHEQGVLLAQLSEMTGRPVSRIVRELVDAAMPGLEAAVVLRRAMEAVDAEKPALLTEAVNKLLAALVEPSTTEQLSMFGSDTPPSHLSSAGPGPDGSGAGRADRSDSDARTTARSHRNAPPRTARGA